MKEQSILLVTNKYAMYRRPLFHKLLDNFNVYFLFTDERRIEDLAASHRVLRKYGIKPFAFTLGLIPVLFSRKFDLVFLPPADSPGELFDNIACFLAARIRRKPYIIWSERWEWKKDRKSIIRQFYLAFDKIIMSYIFRNASACIIGGKKHKEYLLSLNVSENRIFIAPPASVIDRKFNENLEDIKSVLDIGEKKVILYVGRLIRLKGVNYLIEAFAKIRNQMENVSLLIIGGEGLYGKTREERFSIAELEKLSEKLGLKLNRDVFFLGNLIGTDLIRYYQICNVFVLPGVTYVICDAWGLVLNEAMQFEKPVISTDAVGAAYDLIVDGVNGFMVPEKDVNALYRAMSQILSDARIEESMGRESRRIISKYTYENMLDGFEEAINYALQSNK